LLFSATLQTLGQIFVVVLEIAGGLIGKEGPGLSFTSYVNVHFHCSTKDLSNSL